MRLRRIFRQIFIGFLFCWLPAFASAQTSVADLKPAHAVVLKKWLATNSGWQLALEKNYGKDNLHLFREGEGTNVRPFYVAKDFNGDKKEDFAVILIKGKTYAVAVFNAPFNPSKPNFYSDEIESGDILYFNKNTKLLLVGPYASDAGFVLKPSGKTYKVAFFEMED